MAETTVGKGARSRITSRGWEIGRGEYATISAGREIDSGPMLSEMVSSFLKLLKRGGRRNGLPRELVSKTELSFTRARGKLFIKIMVHSQDTRSEKFVDEAAARILKLCRRGPA